MSRRNLTQLAARATAVRTDVSVEPVHQIGRAEGFEGAVELLKGLVKS